MLCVGKTTLLKSKATSLARAGESVTYIFMGGSGKTEVVMNIANKIDFANNPNITVLSQQDLEEKYREEHPWWPSVPSPLFLLNVDLEEGEWGVSPWAPGVLWSVLLLQVLLGEDCDVGVLGKVNLIGDAHHCLCFPASPHEDVGHGLPCSGQARCLALQQSSLSCKKSTCIHMLHY